MLLLVGWNLTEQSLINLYLYQGLHKTNADFGLHSVFSDIGTYFAKRSFSSQNLL